MSIKPPQLVLYLQAAPSEGFKFQSLASMASMQCSKPAEQNRQHQKHDEDHCFGHKVTDMIKGVFKGHHHVQAPEGKASNANVSHCKPSADKWEEHKNKDGNLLHKIKDAFSGHSSDSDNDGHKAHHKRKN